MSLFVRPVSVTDLTQLQLGIEFFTNTTEAMTEAGLITDPPNTPTVFSYAQQLLANNISLSQVAMADDSLMFGVTDNVTELTKLATQFLPAQVAAALAAGLNPTVYAAEALGLALAGGNGTSNAFAGNFSSLSVSDFASAVSNLTGVNSVAIQGFAQNWVSFYTTNPSATFGLSVTLAAYGAAFGDAVGAALLNPTVNGTLALISSEVQNALIDNAEGLYKTGIPLIMEPAHLALQGEAFLIPNAGGMPFGPAIDAAMQFGTNYAEFVAPVQSANLTINNAPSIFTLNTFHFGAKDIQVNAIGNAVGAGKLFTIVAGDTTAGETLADVNAQSYSNVQAIISNNVNADAIESGGDLEIAGGGALKLRDAVASTITDYGVVLTLDLSQANKIDASHAPFLVMQSSAFLVSQSGVTVLGGGAENILHGSLSSGSDPVLFSNGTIGLGFHQVGADNLTGGAFGDTIYVAGADTVALTSQHVNETLIFGQDQRDAIDFVLAITDGNDFAYPGSWGIAGPFPSAITDLFAGATTGGTSADMAVITGFTAGSGGDLLKLKAAAWNGNSSFGALGLAVAKGDMVNLAADSPVHPGGSLVSTVWVNSSSNSSLKAGDNVLLYAPSDASLLNAQQLAAQLHSSADAIQLPGGGHIAAGEHKHILVAYDASGPLANALPTVHIADVDLVNTTAANQTSTANLNIYASDIVSLVGVSLSGLTSDNIHFI